MTDISVSVEFNVTRSPNLTYLGRCSRPFIIIRVNNTKVINSCQEAENIVELNYDSGTRSLCSLARMTLVDIMKIRTSLENLENYRVYLKVEEAVYEFFKRKGYLKVDLPVLSPALIPESYLEVFETEFRLSWEKTCLPAGREKLYLTPSPELFLKRLLMAGVGNCYYLGKSFRNSEPNSSWHQPEFTMLEFYKLGVNYLEMADEVLELLCFIDSKVKRQKLKGKSSSQKLKFDRWEKYSVGQAFEKFAEISKKELFDEKLFIKKIKNKGYKITGATYEDLFSQILAAEIEPKLGKNGRATLLYDYPKQLASLAKLSKDRKTAERCEFYIDGLEVGGFCTELNDYKEQEKRFFSQMVSHSIDKGFIEALKYGLPNCTGAGIGFERLVMTLTNVKSIDKLKLINIK
ncbi:MAG: Elongation factor P-(R)-beta-lysine ligase [Candidatus Roizmanbacteria bacterium GW2011_GWC2_37_13]|uniref:Elongation factor P-(R)-beta-lysine ligase n=1 Tax=Candidatus Roizmanbacteria bacterium GW2011_GWC2_37_13 TaxID=1618486 RepID=A0A0G0IMH4_9BACT|nr:MAG: Elongation factor P-(R)-beta-lysine ligase [Candidatus Roizmanbacteria bacterium GW2011_GWC1_37_12]KKQ25419.1 MAG: Elongation factor P-(R)-beta-lysine ligase [Candidatus Roizmanbacteria bacterium GW2011_GWC2_37_13]